MRIALTGASGLVGRWIARAAVTAGHEIYPLPAWRLGQTPDLTRCDALIHCAFQHLPGKYRGGEGSDPDGFTRANLDGSRALFHVALDQGVGRVVFLSSRAIHDGHPAGAELADELAPAPTSLYGEVKAQAEAELAALSSSDFRTASLRPTGVFGPGQPQKWAKLIRDFLAGASVPSRVATEVHGADLGHAAMLVLAAPDMSGSYNVSDLILDNHDLLSGIAVLTGSHRQPPARADASLLRVPVCARLHALGWRPDGLARLHNDLQSILRDATGEDA
ncbi:NAD-dependent epimerase/dehydratase family protein [Paracoccus aestuariivivens]|uniref:NAD-dependent epimerase/dehydratase family protein n=1 Tax=Paracoccus aestuariivivens TaxID=1820333 RepID=A0A6L6J8E6_9RHOB|nr:NAD(P)-dependent oxidoreductase [Paracoccus aestuariivivens]MTH78260.1 NAD-dependent epimerase/dehydratase family protein [Paracoccus aestuariivivens]